MNKEIEEVCIIGLGPAGATASIYLQRFGISPLCFEKSEIASKIAKTDRIENYPGFVGDGVELAKLFMKHVEANEIRVIKSLVSTIMKEDGLFKIQAEDGIYYAKAVIIATGVKEKEFEIAGAKDFSWRGISRCAICDGPLYKKKDVAVYGNKSTAFIEANYLATLSPHVYMISEHIDAPDELVEEFTSKENTTLLCPYKIMESTGERSLETLKVKNIDTEEEKTIEVKGLFLYVGIAMNTTFLPFPEIFTSAGFIKTDAEMKTEIEGLFAVGDARLTSLRQIVTAASDGAICSLSVKTYLKGRK